MWNRFKRSKPLIVEVAKLERPPEYTPELKRSVATLQSHPGFLYLLAKLRFQRSVLRSSFESKRHSNIVDAEYFQSGIAWSGWLETEMNQAIDFKQAAPVAATPSELSVFEESQRMLEVLR